MQALQILSYSVVSSTLELTTSDTYHTIFIALTKFKLHVICFTFVAFSFQTLYDVHLDVALVGVAYPYYY